MLYPIRIYVFILLVAMASPARSQEPAKDLPDVGVLLQRAREQISSLEKEYERSHRYRRTALLFGRSGDVDAAFEAMERAFAPEAPSAETAAIAKQEIDKREIERRESEKRERYLNLVEAIASQRNGEAAIKVVDGAPEAYRRHSDHAYGRIALTAASERDADGAWQAISRIKRSAYPYELHVAVTLEDKARARKISLGEHKLHLEALAGRVDLAREEWAAILSTLSLYQWCELEKEFEELIERACATTEDPATTRAETMGYLEAEAAKGSTEPKEIVTKMPLAIEDIRSMLAAANRSDRPREKADLLLNVAEEVLRFRQSATPPGGD
jgi:cell division septum initiation protein DivIVA